MSYAETRTLFTALMQSIDAPLSEDPSCKADLSTTGAVPIRDALVTLFANAATAKKAVVLNASCFVRKNYPIEKAQEYCKLGLGATRRAEMGLLFKMDWAAKKLVPGSAECF